jgi:sphinganine-1-phosphate aldolase
MRDAVEICNDKLTGLQPYQIVVLSVLAVVMIQYSLSFAEWMRENCNIQNIKSAGFKFAAAYIPQVKAHIDGELEKLRVDSVKKYGDKRKGVALYELPNKGTSPDAVLKKIKDLALPYNKYFKDGGNITGAVYNNETSHWDFLSEAMRPALPSNPLHLTEFAYVNTMEAEIVRWTLNLYNGGPKTCGIVTSGGTESIILAMLAYREKAFKERGVTKPNIVMSETGHCAFDKAGFYYQIEIRKVPITKDYMADLDGMRRQIDKNTICLVASAPEYAYGNYDPVEDIAALA